MLYGLKFEMELVRCHRCVYFGGVLRQRDEGRNNVGLFCPDKVHFCVLRHLLLVFFGVKKIEL